jgi:hypothetical protein
MAFFRQSNGKKYRQRKYQNTLRVYFLFFGFGKKPHPVTSFYRNACILYEHLMISSEIESFLGVHKIIHVKLD